jgi:hypothetical protein
MTHVCPKCKSDYECIYKHCPCPKESVCFVCFSKDWHVAPKREPK